MIRPLSNTTNASHRDERGAAAIVIAISLLVLMGFAALVVDLGAGFNERAQDQSAADVAALAAVQFAVPDSACPNNAACINSALTNGANEAIAVATGSVDDPTRVDWSNPALCSSPPSEYTRVSPASNCVWFNENLQKAWVQIPYTDLPTTFGRTIGFASVEVSAFAEAGSELGVKSAVIPFLLPGSGAASVYECLKTQGNLVDWDVCEDYAADGNFGSMDFALYGNSTLDTTQECNPNVNRGLVSNIARGVDHPLGKHPDGVTFSKLDHDDGGLFGLCPIFDAEPDMAPGRSGVGSDLDDGLTTGADYYNSAPSPYPGRLARGSNTLVVRDGGGGNPATEIDDTPLWSYLVTGLPSPCDSVGSQAEMRTCLAAWTSGMGVIFEPSIETAVRLAFVPEMWEFDFINPSGIYHIKDFRPVYLDGTFYGCNAHTCKAVHTPGEASLGSCGAGPTTSCGLPASKSSGINALTAYILTEGMLPANATNPFPGATNQVEHFLTR